MRHRFHKFLALSGFLLALFVRPAVAQQVDNDGFQRRNGQMLVVRNGQARPMTRDAHLPTGATVTKDGFVVAPDGQRTELREGQGCDLRGRTVAVRTTAGGALALAPAAEAVRERGTRAAVPTRGLIEQLFGARDDNNRAYRYKKYKKGKGHGKGKGHWKNRDEDDD